VVTPTGRGTQAGSGRPSLSRELPDDLAASTAWRRAATPRGLGRAQTPSTSRGQWFNELNGSAYRDVV